jgi:hypothetical protein
MESTILKPLVIIILTGVFVNLTAVNYVIYKQLSSPKIPVPSAKQELPPKQQSACDENCVRQIVTQATSSISIASPDITSHPIKTIKATPVASSAPARELFVSIGSGKSTTSDWNDVIGTEVTLSPSQYGNSQGIYFQATLSIPSTEGIVYARLYNTTDGMVVAASDVSTTNSSPTLLTSQPIVLEGTKVYKVQMKSSLEKDAILTQSRIKVVLR